MSEELVLKAQVYIGDQADTFLKSELGQYLVGVSKQEVRDYTEQLRSVNPRDSERIASIQMKINVAEQAIEWIIDAINQGETALQMIQSEEERV